MKIFEKYTSSGSIFSVDVDISGKIMMQIEGWMKNTIFILLPPVLYFLLILFFISNVRKGEFKGTLMNYSVNKITSKEI